MAADVEAILKRGCWWIPRRPAFFLSALWVGSQIAAYALIPGLLMSGVKFDRDLLRLISGSPMLLWNDWLCLNAAVIALAIWRFRRPDSLDIREWGWFAGSQALFGLIQAIHDVKGPLAVGVTWGAWLVLVAMLGTGTWFAHQWQRNRWAAEIAMLKSENASRLAHQEDEDASEDSGNL